MCISNGFQRHGHTVINVIKEVNGRCDQYARKLRFIHSNEYILFIHYLRTFETYTNDLRTCHIIVANVLYYSQKNEMIIISVYSFLS